jgi:hypothetical protein
MKKTSKAKNRWSFLLSIIVLGLAVALIALPYQFRSKAEDNGIDRTESLEEGLPKMYDIREDKDAANTLLSFRESAGKNALTVEMDRKDFVRGEEALKQRLPNVKVEYNTDIRIPEVITPDVWKAQIEFLTAPSDVKRSEILRNFVKQNNLLIGVTDEQANALKVAADYTNPNGYMSFAHLEQLINGIPVFRGEIKAGFTKDGRMIRVINNLAPGLEYNSLSTDFGNPSEAVRAAARYMNYEVKGSDVIVNEAASTNLKVKFGNGDDSATQAEKMYFPIEPGVAVPAWRVLIWQNVNTYYVIVDTTGRMLWRKNITDDQTQSVTYNVYTNSNAMINVADSPFPFTPGPVDPTMGQQGTGIMRTSIMRIGNEAPYTFNNNGWITDGGNDTNGNAVEAGLDRETPNAGPTAIDPNGRAVGNPNRVFNFPINPGVPTNPPGTMGDPPLPTTGTGTTPTPCVAVGTAQAPNDYQKAVVTQLFYVNNWYHDELYRLGFTEQARNFQLNNFGRGGVENDHVSAQAQDCGGTNNANFATPADGTRGTMQMFLWTGPTPDYDGDLDADVIIHEHTHGLSNRLHGNGSGLGTNMAGGMGEGWSDFYAHSLLSEATDPTNGIYTTGGYATHLIQAGFVANYYYGIRRFPKAVIAFTGGPPRVACNNMPCPHNPLSFRHLNSNCATEIGTTTVANISAFPRGPIGVAQCDQVHNAGEIWSSALWETRALIVTRLGWAVGNRRTLQIVTDGMKLAPLNPTFLQERDAIIMAASVLPVAPEASADVADVREGFRRRGMGFSASIQTVSPAAVTEAFDLPNAVIATPITVSDAPGDGDGFPEPGENLLIDVPITNNSGGAVNNVMGTITGGGSANYGNLSDGQTVTRQITYTVPAGATCGGLHTITITGTSSVGQINPRMHTFRLGAPVGGAPVTFSSNTLVTIPNGAPTTTSGPAMPYNTDIVVSGLTGNKLVKLEITGITHTFPGDLDFLLVGPGGVAKYIGLSDSGGGGDVTNLTFTLSDAAAAQPSTAQWVAGDFRPYNTGANDAFVAPAPAPPYTNAAPAGADTLTSVFGINSANLNGTWSLYIVDDAGGDVGTMAGWKLTFESNDYSCVLASGNNKPIADFDGDNKTDASIFRMGTWWINRSMGGTSTIPFGAAGDTLVPGDYDADNKADLAVYRNGVWYILNSSNGAVQIFTWGIAGDTAVPADYDGDGDADAAVYRNGTWFVRSATGGIQSANVWGIAGDVPVRGDFDGDGKSDLAVRRVTNMPVTGDTNYYILYSGGSGGSTVRWGSSSYQSAVGDYNGDGKDDVGVAYILSGNMIWAVKNADNTVQFDGAQWGSTGDTAVTGDYDGDGKYDLAVFRPSNNTWYIRKSSDTMQTTIVWGATGDVIVPRSYQTP